MRPPHDRGTVPPRQCASRREGFTLLEVLVALAIVGVVAGAGQLALRPAGAARAAAGARAFLLAARLDAVWSGRAVAVVPAGSQRTLVARRSAGPDTASACAGAEIRRFEIARYPGVRVDRPLRSGIVWLPNGGARSCSGGGVINGRMELVAGTARSAVVVSSLGRVRIEVAR